MLRLHGGHAAVASLATASSRVTASASSIEPTSIAVARNHGAPDTPKWRSGPIAAANVSGKSAGPASVACDVDIVIEATGSVEAGASNALRAIEHGRHVIMVTVEADVVVGPILQRKAEAAGVVYSMAYGDQPALTAN